MWSDETIIAFFREKVHSFCADHAFSFPQRPYKPLLRKHIRCKFRLEGIWKQSTRLLHLMGSNRELFTKQKKGLLENALSLRTSAHAGVAIPRIFKHLGRKTKLFPSNRGAATPVTSVTGSQRHTFLTAPLVRVTGFDNIMVQIPSSRNLETVHRTVSSNGFESGTFYKTRKRRSY